MLDLHCETFETEPITSSTTTTANIDSHVLLLFFSLLASTRRVSQHISGLKSKVALCKTQRKPHNAEQALCTFFDLDLLASCHSSVPIYDEI